MHADLNNPGDFLIFIKSVNGFLKKNPNIIACDLHPEYQSSKYAHRFLASKFKLFPIQHHHAHIAACMADNALNNQRVIGVAFDGTGLGIDNTLWGAEFLVCNYKSFIRKAHLKEIPLLGGERAILEPWRLAAFWLYLVYKDKFLKLDIDFMKRMNKNKWQFLKKMYEKKINTPLTTSMGRLFDAAASLILAKERANFEAELAIRLERTATKYKGRIVSSYAFDILKKQGSYIIDPCGMFREIIRDLKAKVAKEEIAYKFHISIAEMIKKVNIKIRQTTGIKKIVLSGGVFQNKLLGKITSDLLHQENFKVFTHNELSCNDSGLSLGQAVIAGMRN
jgi:hydrogenase maturation protein HypF